MRRIISMVLVVSLLLSLNVFASPDVNIETATREEYFLDMGHGEFRIDTGLDGMQTTDSNKKKVKVKKLNSEIYEILDTAALVDNIEYNKLLKVKEDTLLRVKELKVNLLNSKQVEEYIEDYDISPEMAEDIRARAELAQQKDSEIDTTIYIYTPSFSKKEKNTLAMSRGINLASLSSIGGVNIASLSRQSTYYYTGFNGENYKDETWFGRNSPTYYNVRTGYTVKDYFDDVLNNTCEFAIGAIADTLTSGAYTLAEIFAYQPILGYPSNSGDVWQAALNETKWRKYTSIELWDDVTSSYKYYVRAVSDKAIANFSHYLYRAYNGAKDYSDDDLEEYIGDYHYDLDEKAYQHMYDLPYTEYLEYYTVNDYTAFSSQH